METGNRNKNVGEQIVQYVFFGNYFYGICAVALCIEASLQQGYSLNSIYFYAFIFAATVLFYTRAYITEKKTGSNNPRSIWYYDNRRFVFMSQVVLTIVALVYPVKLLVEKLDFILALPLTTWALLFLFPIAGGLYYGINHRALRRFNLRNIGWLKPFLIGWVWAGLVTVYPVIFQDIEEEKFSVPDFTSVFLFVKNFMFITVLCIMFDIKDYAADHNRQLKTFVVKAGLRKTIFMILIPLCVLGLGSYLMFSLTRHFSDARILINVIPFLLLIAVAYSMYRRKSILYYLVVIDGLMLVKALCGSVGVFV